MAKSCHFIFNTPKQPLTLVRVAAIWLNGPGAHIPNR
jgi:hypothetical protein